MHTHGGDDVRTIQRQLNRISDVYSNINKIRVDGIFGENTERAVKTFQETFNMTADGKVGLATWYQISQVYVAIEKLAEL